MPNLNDAPDGRENPKDTFDLGNFISSIPLRYARPMPVKMDEDGMLPPVIKQADSTIYDPSKHYGDMDYGLAPVRPSSSQQSDKNAGMTVPMKPTQKDRSSQVYVVNQPDFQMYRKDTGSTVMTLRRETEFMSMISSNDLEPIRNIVKQMFNNMKSMSRGPYSLKDLSKMGHPYGFERNAKGEKIARRKVARNIYGKAIGHPKGMRGSTPTLSIVNLQSGKFEADWRWSLLFDGKGISINVWNINPISWYLAAGTIKMQAHGPFTYIPMKYLDSINQEFSRVVSQSYHRNQLEEQLNNNLNGW